jgi:hypothetical protein
VRIRSEISDPSPISLRPPTSTSHPHNALKSRKLKLESATNLIGFVYDSPTVVEKARCSVCAIAVLVLLPGAE